jgi:hypothetical protein
MLKLEELPTQISYYLPLTDCTDSTDKNLCKMLILEELLHADYADFADNR